MKIKKTILKKVYKKRDKWSHKGQAGRLLVIGGNEIYSGSPALAALAAYRAGSDLVYVAAPERAANIIASFSPDIITIPLPGSCLRNSHVDALEPYIEKTNAIVIGGGLGRRKDTFEASTHIMDMGKPTVSDADAIHGLGGLARNVVFTPHAREFKVMTGSTVSNDLKSRREAVKKYAKRYDCTILLKGHKDVISNGQKVAVNKSGNAFMAKGGTGDTLAGIAGSLLARGASNFEAACAAAYINGRAGDLAARSLKEGFTASDLLEFIPKAIR